MCEFIDEKISFSSDSKKLSRKDFDDASQLSEEYFGTQKDPSQMATSPENRDWIYKNAKEYLNVIKKDGKLIGYAFILPCNKKIMDEFLVKNINEAELFEKIKKVKLKEIPETIYLCAAVVKKEYRGKGLAKAAFVKAIMNITHNLKGKPILFYWGYSKEGIILSKKIAELSDLELRVKE